MVLDARGLDYTDSFKRVHEIISYGDLEKDELTVLVDSAEMSGLIKGFSEIIFGCASLTEEQDNKYLVKIRGFDEVRI